MWIKYVSVPVDAYKRILFFFEVCKLFLFQRTQAFKQLFCFFKAFLLKKAAVSTVLFPVPSDNPALLFFLLLSDIAS